MENQITQHLQFISSKEILSLREACIYMDVSTSFLYKLTSSRRIPHFKPSGKLIYFRRTDLDSWMTSVKRESLNESIAEIESFISKSSTDD